MALDLDAWAERSAVMEFDAGLTRFEAETAAARAQGYQRHEVIDAIRKRNSQQARDQREAPARNAAHDLSGMQPGSKEENRPMPQRDVQGGWRAMELLALRMGGGRVLR